MSPREGVTTACCERQQQLRVDDFHELLSDFFWVGMLDDIAAVNDAGGTLGDEVAGTAEDFLVGNAATAPYENGDAGCDLDDLVVLGNVVSGIGFDDVSSQFYGLADEVSDFREVAIDHVSAGFGIGAENEGLDHHGHAVVIGLGLEAEDIIDALGVDFGCAGDMEKVHAHTCGIEADGLKHGLLDHFAETRSQQFLAIDVGDIGAEDKGGLLLSRYGLEMASLADGELDRVRAGIDEGLHDVRHVLNSLKKTGLIEKAVIDGDVEAAV